MGRTALKYTGVLIGTYLLVYYATGAGTLLNQGQQAGTSIIKTLQGR